MSADVKTRSESILKREIAGLDNSFCYNFCCYWIQQIEWEYWGTTQVINWPVIHSASGTCHVTFICVVWRTGEKKHTCDYITLSGQTGTIKQPSQRMPPSEHHTHVIVWPFKPLSAHDGSQPSGTRTLTIRLTDFSVVPFAYFIAHLQCFTLQTAQSHN